MMHTQSLKFLLKLSEKFLSSSGRTIKLVICAAINGAKFLNIFDILEVEMSKRIARSLLRRSYLNFVKNTNE